MAGETTITVIGNLTSDPELRFTPSGSAVANFTIASTPRTFDRQSNEWKDGETLFLRASVWREMAENVAESLTKGSSVVAQGVLKSRSYETKEGEKRTVIELEVQEIGTSLKYATAKPVKVNRQNRQQGGQQQGGYPQQGGYGQPQGQPQGGYQQQPQYAGQPQGGGYQQAPAQQDPWAPTGLPGQSQQDPGQWGNGPGQEPPF